MVSGNRPPLRVRRLAAGLALALTLPLAAEDAPSRDWPQFRGPERAGVSPATGLVREWPADGPKTAWRRALGEGFSGISVAQGGVFTLFQSGENEWAVRLDPASGAEVWKVAIGPRFDEELGNGPRATPTVDGERVFVLSSTGRLHALAAADGKVLWTVDGPGQLGARQPMRGFTGSPLADGELLIVEMGAGPGKGIFAFDKATGAVRWTVRDTPTGHSSPIAVTIGGQRQYVFVHSAGREITSISPEGAVLWTHPWPPGAIAMPVFVPPDRILVSATDDVGAVLLKVAVAGGRTTVEEVWRNRLLKNHFSSSVALGGHVYGFDNGTLKCLDAATGEQRWAYRGFGKGSLIAADGLLVILSDRGLLALAEATPEAYREHGRSQVFQSKTWTAPTLAAGRLFLRDEAEIVCLEVAS